MVASGSNGGDIDPVEQYAPEEVATGQPTGSDAGFGVSIASQLLDDDFVGEERQAIVRAIISRRNSRDRLVIPSFKG